MDWTTAPLINYLHPEGERPAARHISNQLFRLGLHLNYFEKAVALVDHCLALTDSHLAGDPTRRDWKVRAQFGDWMTIAGRDAALTVYHFQSTVRSIRDQLHRAPTLHGKVDTKALEQAYSRIDHEFPGWKSLRDAVGHWADMSFKPEEFEKHRIPDGPSVQSTFDVVNRRLIMTRNGRYQILEVTNESLQKLVSITAGVHAAFAKAAVPRRPA